MVPVTLSPERVVSDTVLVIGGGLAGLTAALHLSARGFRVTVVDKQARLGGRLHDAAPLVLLGCHTATWSLLETLGTGSLVHQPHTPLEFLQAGGHRVQYASLPLPSPLNTLVGTSLFQGLSLRDRWQLLSFIERTWEQAPGLPPDLELRTAQEWLTCIGQSEQARTETWNPLSRFLLGDDLSAVSAALFLRSLRRSFFTGIRHSRITIPEMDVSAMFLVPGQRRLAQAGQAIRLDTPIHHVRFNGERVQAVELADRTLFSADWYVLALPRQTLCDLLPDRLVTHFSYFEQIGHLTESPTMVVQLQTSITLSRSHVILLPHGTFHWLLARPHPEKDGSTVWLVASGHTTPLTKPDYQILNAAREDLFAACPSWRRSTTPKYHITREPRALLAAQPGTQQYRPLQVSPISNLFLAGDWTDTGWPANLESAITSGIRAAEAIAAVRKTPHLIKDRPSDTPHRHAG